VQSTLRLPCVNGFCPRRRGDLSLAPGGILGRIFGAILPGIHRFVSMIPYRFKNKRSLRDGAKDANASLKAKDALRDFVIDTSISRRRQRRRADCEMLNDYANLLSEIFAFHRRLCPEKSCLGTGISLPPSLSSRGIQRRPRSRCLRDPGDFRATRPPVDNRRIVDVTRFPLVLSPSAFPEARLGNTKRPGRKRAGKSKAHECVTATRRIMIARTRGEGGFYGIPGAQRRSRFIFKPRISADRRSSKQR